MRIQSFFLTGCLIGWIALGCQSQEQTPSAPTAEKKESDSIPALRPYSQLLHEGTEQINAEPGTKSVLFDHERKHLYAMNLEGMSVAEYDRASRKAVRYFRFEKTKGKGWD